jgi:hypothetical protein
MEYRVIVTRPAGVGHPVWMFQPQPDGIVGIESDVVTTVDFLHAARMQMGDISYIFSRFQSVPMCDGVSAAGQRFDRVEEEMRVTVRRDWR